MSAALRLVDTGVAPARWNIAVTAALAECRRAPDARDVLRFHRYRRSVLLGRGQAVDDAVDIPFCRSRGVEIARRVTGGGAVHMSPSVLAFDLVVLCRPGFGPERLSGQVGDGVAAALSTLGVAGGVVAPNAVLVGGRKLCGFSGGFDGAVAVMQASVLVDVDRSEMAGVLRPQMAAGAPPMPVVGLSELLGRPAAMADVVGALATALSAGWPMTVAGDLGAAEQALAARLLGDELGTESFVMGEGGEPRLGEVPA